MSRKGNARRATGAPGDERGAPLSALLPAALILAATALAYLPAMRGGFIWDDDAHVTGNAALKTVAGLRRIWLEPQALPQYYPLVHTTFWLEYRLWGTSPLGFHLVNVLLHALNALLLGTILKRLVVPGAWLAAAIFALHPVHVESVAWVSERKNVLSGLLYFLSALALLRFFRLWEPSPSGRERRWGWYAAGCLLFLAALLAKTVTASLPAALFVLLWWKRERVRWRDGALLAPLLAAGAAMGLVTAWIEKHHVGAEGAIWSLPFTGRILVAGRALWFYAWKLVWPAKLIFFYPRWVIDPRVWYQWLFPAAALGFLLALWLGRRRIGKGPLAAFLFFTVTLAPALGFFDVFPMRYSWVADHFQYLASAGPIALLAAMLAGSSAVARTRPPAGRPESASRDLLRHGAAGLLLLVLAALTWRQALIYKDSETLWRDTLAKDPGSWAARNNLGFLLAHRGEPQAAAVEYEKALRLNPDFIEAHNNLGTLLSRQGRTEEAAEQFRAAVRLEGHYFLARLNLATALIKLGRSGEAIAQLEAVLRDQPDLIPAHEKLALALEREGRTEGARAERAKTLRLKAWVRATHESDALRNGEEAIALARQACELSGYSQAQALDALAAAYAEAGRFSEAIATARKALSIAEVNGSQGDLANGIRRRLAAYEAGRPWRDPSLSQTYSG